jgi:hypothetical protein
VRISALLCLLKMLKNSMPAIGQRFFILLITYLILTGCSTILFDSSETRDRHLQMDEVMQYYSGLLDLPADELVAEYYSVREKFVLQGSDEYRIKYTLLLTLPNKKFSNMIIALRVLTAWPQEEGSNLNGFRLLLMQLITEQQHLKLVADSFHERLKIKQQRVKILQDRIDAIIEMEKNLMKRGAIETN